MRTLAMILSLALVSVGLSSLNAEPRLRLGAGRVQHSGEIRHLSFTPDGEHLIKQAAELLRRLADGPKGLRETREAREALERMGK